MPSSFGSLTGQVALITGGAGGLGREAALWLAVAGAQVVVADVSAAALERAETWLSEKLPDATSFHYAALDVTDAAAVRDLVAGIASRHGRLDILLTSHGFPRDRRLEDMTDDDWNQVIGVCLTGTFLCIRESARLMVPQAYGRIIAVASRAWQGNPGQANYSAAKAGVTGLTKTIAKEWGQFKVNVNAVAFGFVETRLTQAKEKGEQLETATGEKVDLGIPEQMRAMATMVIPLGRPAQPEEAAGPVLFLASGLANYVQGQIVNVTGGQFGGMTT